MDRLLHHIGKYNQEGDAVSFEGIIRRKKKDGSSVGDMRRFLLKQGCFIGQCRLCHHLPVTKSAKKAKGRHKHSRGYLNEIDDL